MKTFPKLSCTIFFGMLLGIAALAAAHHGNPQAPAPSWDTYLPPGTSRPAPPAAPGM